LPKGDFLKKEGKMSVFFLGLMVAKFQKKKSLKACQIFCVNFQQVVYKDIEGCLNIFYFHILFIARFDQNRLMDDCTYTGTMVKMPPKKLKVTFNHGKRPHSRR
jgi:hypothetical protein